MSFKILTRETVFQTRAFNVQSVQLQLPNSKLKNYDLVDHPDSVSILAVDPQGNILFVSQYRLGADQDLLELPAGVLDDGEEPSTAARRELREETGFDSENMHLLGDFYLAPGYANEHMFVYYASHLFPSSLKQDEDEFLSLQKIPVEEALRKTYAGQFKDAKTIAALMLALPLLKA
ncbi:MAG: hypothetical protein BGO78_07035 [Chloroflexi bacterium 44-23]|nr:MAG: hypothetical protein BGO78_07035 [Chloroflexi bacterium 44-23]